MSVNLAEIPHGLAVAQEHVTRVHENSTPATRKGKKRSKWKLQGGGRGGGMRVAGMLVGAKELGLLSTPDEVDATSASTHSSVVAWAGDPHEGLRHFLFPYYLFRGGKIINVHDLAEGIVGDIDTDRFLHDPDLPQIDWHTTSINTGNRLSLSPPTTPTELHINLVASSIPPFLGGLKPVTLSSGEKVTDNGLVEGSVTAPPEREDAEEMLVYLMADPEGTRRIPSRLEQAGAVIYDLQGHRKAGELLRNYWRRKNATLEAIDRAKTNSRNVLVISAPATAPGLSMTGGNYKAMVQAARSGYDAVMEVFVPLGLRPRRPSHVPSFGDIFSYARA
jgi:hypothetical protein